MRRVGVVLAAMSAFAATAGGERSAAKFGDVTLQGPVGDRLEQLIRNHVAVKDPVYLAACFKNRSETCEWQTEFWGKYMHGACPLWELTKCPALRAKIDASTEAVRAAQDAEGYIGNYSPALRYAPKTWDVWGSKYVLMGLLHHYDMTGDRRDLDAALKLCRYVAKKVGPDAQTTIASTGNYAGQPSCSILEPVVWLYNRTKEADILAFADFIVKEMTENPNGPRLVDLAARCVPVAERSELPKGARSIWDGVPTNRGKAYEMMSCYQGLIEYCEVKGRPDLLDAAVATAWDIATQEINIAGSGAAMEHWYHGAEHQHEPFGHTQETCVTITWMRLCETLLALTGDVRWADQFERTFYNAYLASLSADGRTFAAYTPLNGTRHEGNIHCRMHTNCCNENGPRGFVAFLRSLVQAKDDEVFLNYYVSSRSKIAVPATGETAEFEMHTLYPKQGHVDVFVRNAKPAKFKLSVRIPGWAAGVKMKVNATAIDGKNLGAGRWVTHERAWKDGDHLQLDFDLPVVTHRLGNSVAFTRGPVVLARDTRFADGDLSETLRASIDWDDSTKTFRPVRSPDPSVWMAFEAQLPFGLHDENPDRRLPAGVRFCDYASAGNRWRPDNACRVWLPLSRNVIDALPKTPVLDRTKFLVGTTGLGGIKDPKEEHVKDLADCGIDFVNYGNPKRHVLDWCKKHGVKTMLGWQLPGDWWWTGDAKKKFKNGERWAKCDMDKVDRYAARFVDHPAVAGICTCDEPNALDYAYLAKLVGRVRRDFPGKFVFFNLFPNYALPDSAGQERAKSQLGTADYERYVAEYVAKIPLDYISYDFYPWAWKVTKRQFYDNMRVVADACTATGKSHWLYLQANHYNGSKTQEYPVMDEPRLRYQANVALAYGAECIIWACWAKGWWDVNVVDENGSRTEVYEPLKRVNASLHALSGEYMKYRRAATDLVGLEGELDASSSAAFRNVRASDGAALAVGHFNARAGNGDYALYVAAVDDPDGVKAVRHTVTFAFAQKGYRLRAVDDTGAATDLVANADGTFAVPLTTCRGVLVVAERK